MIWLNQLWTQTQSGRKRPCVTNQRHTLEHTPNSRTQQQTLNQRKWVSVFSQTKPISDASGSDFDIRVASGQHRISCNTRAWTRHPKSQQSTRWWNVNGCHSEKARSTRLGDHNIPLGEFVGGTVDGEHVFHLEDVRTKACKLVLIQNGTTTKGQKWSQHGNKTVHMENRVPPLPVKTLSKRGFAKPAAAWSSVLKLTRKCRAGPLQRCRWYPTTAGCGWPRRYDLTRNCCYRSSCPTPPGWEAGGTHEHCHEAAKDSVMLKLVKGWTGPNSSPRANSTARPRTFTLDTAINERKRSTEILVPPCREELEQKWFRSVSQHHEATVDRPLQVLQRRNKARKEENINLRDSCLLRGRGCTRRDDSIWTPNACWL